MATKSFFLRERNLDELFEGVNYWDDNIEEWDPNDPDVHIFDKDGEEIKDVEEKERVLRLFKFLITMGESSKINKSKDH